MTDSIRPRVYADFHNADPKGRLRLNGAGSLDDLARQNVHLREGLDLDLYSDDADDEGLADELSVTGRLQYSRDEQVWVAVIDWNAIRHAGHAPKNAVSPRKAAS